MPLKEESQSTYCLPTELAFSNHKEQRWELLVISHTVGTQQMLMGLHQCLWQCTFLEKKFWHHGHNLPLVVSDSNTTFVNLKTACP